MIKGSVTFTTYCTGSKRPNFKPKFSSILEQKKVVKDIQLEPKSSSLPDPSLPKKIPTSDSFLAEMVELRRSVQALQLQQLQLQNQFLTHVKGVTNNNMWPQLGQMSL